MAVALELFLAVFEFGLFQLNQDLRDIGFVFVKNADVGALFLTTESYFVFHLDSVGWVTQVVPQNHQVQLPNCLFRCELDRLATRQAGHIGRGLFVWVFDGDARFQLADLLGFELVEFVRAVFQQFGKCDGHEVPVLGFDG